MDFRALLPIQAVDHRLVQLAHRKAELPERGIAAAAQRAVDVANIEVKKCQKRQSDITGEINKLEVRGHELTAKKLKYEAQLKTVIAVREAEALQHEIVNVATVHSLLDDAELTLLEESEGLDASLAQLRDSLPALEATASAAAANLAAALAAVDAEIAAAQAERASLAAAVDTASLDLYEGVRARMTSAAVAEIVRGSCSGCHTSLSVKEQAEMKKIADTPDAVCPYCGCLLAV